jgi:predicted amidophosphoribosyltransferase
MPLYHAPFRRHWRAIYLSQTDGEQIPYTQCHECGEDAYIIDEQCCALCGESAEHTCAICGNDIIPEELDSSPYCGWCAHQMAKDD